MGAFDYIIVLLSFVFALALTHLLSRVGELLLARDRVQLSRLQVVAILNALMEVYLNWLTIWDLRSVKDWDLLSITVLFGYAVLNYFVCVAAAPAVPEEGPIDLEAFYARNHRIFWGLIALLMVWALATNAVLLKTSNPRLFLQTSLATLPFFAPPVLALAVSARWAQWVSGVGLMVLSIGWLILFNRALN